MVFPEDFAEEAEIYYKSKQAGVLSLMAKEAEDFPWRKRALRIIGEKLFLLKDYENCCTIWEKLLKTDKNDVEANELLATIYQRLAEKEASPEESEEKLAKSDAAIEKFLAKTEAENYNKIAEAWALKGRNAKSRWLQSWRNLPESEQQAGALTSVFLFDAFTIYRKGYYEFLNHFYFWHQCPGAT